MNRHTFTHENHEQERGAALVEYILLFSLIVLVCLASVTAFGDGVSGSVDDSASRVVEAGGDSGQD